MTRTALLTSVAILLASQPAAAQASGEVAAHFGQATRLMEDRLFGEAAAEFEKALAADPNNDNVRIAYATSLFEQERNDEARKQWEIERQRLGTWLGLEYYLGRLDLRDNNFTSAIRRLQPLESNPAFPKTSLYLGLAYLSSNQPAKALESLERAAKNDPHDPEVHYRLGRVYFVAGRTDDAEREYKLYREWREIQRTVEEDGHLCMDALRTQPIAEARAICQKIADPHDPRRLILLGQLYAGAGAYLDAVGPLQQAVDLDPKSFEGWHFLGLSLYGLHRYPEAVEPLEKAAALNPHYFDTLNLLAKTLHLLGNDRAALPVLERAHTLNPGDAALTAVLERMRAALQPKP